MAAVPPGVRPGDPLPPHQPNCFGCGPANPAGFQLRCHATERGVAGSFRLDTRHEGGPGVAHGGVVAAVLDDLLGFLLYRIGRPMVTARLEIDYRRPVLLGIEAEAEAEIVSVDGRKVWTRGELRGPDAGILAEARGLFVQVPPDHFARLSPDAGLRLAAWHADEAGPGPVAP